MSWKCKAWSIKKTQEESQNISLNELFNHGSKSEYSHLQEGIKSRAALWKEDVNNYTDVKKHSDV